MDFNVFFTLCNAIGISLTLSMFYPAFTATSADDLNNTLTTRPTLQRAIARAETSNYLRQSIYFAIYFVVVLITTWKLRKLLGKPTRKSAGVSQ